jgi:hypothetical protein
MKPSPDSPPRLPWTALWSVLFLQFLTASGRIGNADSGLMLALTRSLIQGTVAVEGNFDTLMGIDGKPVCHYGILTSVLWILPVLLGRSLASATGIASIETWEELCVGFTVPLLAWALLLLICIEWRRAGLQTRLASAGVLLFAFATLLFPYSKREGSDLPMALALFSAWCVVRPHQPSHTRLALSGFFLGLAFLARTPAAILIPPLTLAIVLGRAHLSSPLPAIQGLLTVIAGFLPPAAVHFIYNHARYGNPWTLRYVNAEPYQLLPLDRWLNHAFGVLSDPVHGLVPYCLVPLVIFIIAFPSLRSAQPTIARLIPVLALCQIILLSGYSFWGGSIGFGARFFVFLIPFAALAWPTCTLALQPSSQSFLAAAVALSFPIHFTGVLVDPLLPHVRTEFDHTHTAVNYCRELARFAGLKWGQPSHAVLTSPNFNHPPLQYPDLWWLHAINLIRNRS